MSNFDIQFAGRAKGQPIIPVVIGPPGASVPAPGGLYYAFTGIVNGQNTFTLPQSPQVASSVFLYINGTRYGNPDISVSGPIITWNHLFTILSTDDVEATY